MQSIQFDIEKLGLGPRALAPPAGAGGFDQILGRTKDELPRPDTYGETANDRPRQTDRPENADRADYSPQRERRLEEQRDRSRDEDTGRAAGDDNRARPDQSDDGTRMTTDRRAQDGSDDRAADHAAKTDEDAGTQDSTAFQTTPGTAAEPATMDSAKGTAPAVTVMPKLDQTTKAANQEPAVGIAKNSDLPISDIAPKAATALGQAAANPALQRSPQQETSPQSDRNAGSGPAPGSKASTTIAQGHSGKGSVPASRPPNSDASGLELSLQKGPATSGSPTQMSSATALGVLQEQAVAEVQKAESEARAPLRTGGQQKASLAAELAGTNGQPGRQGGDLGQQKGPGAGQFLNTPATGSQGGPASSATSGQPIASTVLPAATGSEAAPTHTPSGLPIPAAAAGNPTGLMQAAIQAAAPEHLRQGPSQQGPAEQISVQIQTAVKSGIDRISIQLNPAELGKIEVKMELGDDGQLRAVISAEKPETLELLQKDARGLEKSLQDAGLKTDMNSLAFQKGGDGRGPSTEGQLAGPSNKGSTSTTGNTEAEQARTSLHDGSLDISV